MRIFLKASSTLVESRAEVSINDRVFFSENEEKTAYGFTYYTITTFSSIQISFSPGLTVVLANDTIQSSG